MTSKNVDEKLKSPNPEIKRLLGTEGNFGEGLGLTQDWAYRIIKLVGNYGEVFEKNVGEGSKLKIKRGINALWTNKRPAVRAADPLIASRGRTMSADDDSRAPRPRNLE